MAILKLSEDIGWAIDPGPVETGQYISLESVQVGQSRTVEVDIVRMPKPGAAHIEFRRTKQNEHTKYR